ncbi:hypothetical protein, partial [Streptomyces sp. NPDC005303]|uniref:hypothetical protein n=1 Tax=Streptomyces sp. NPDC005303 TaxID=3155713 RepID=UPI0033B365B7
MSSPATAPPAPNNLKRIVAACHIGTTIEWYDDSSDRSDDLRSCPNYGLKVSTEPAPPSPRPRRRWMFH